MRLGSSRLPGKSVLPLPSSSKLIGADWINRFLLQVDEIDEVIYAIPDTKLDNTLAHELDQRGLNYFRGSEEDVLSRFASIIKKSSYKTVLRFTGDNVILDIASIKETLKYFVSNRPDYLLTKGLPIGQNIEIFKASSLLKLAEIDNLTDLEREHVTLGFRQRESFNSLVLQIKNELASDFRLTIDYDLDYLVINFLLSRINTSSLLNIPSQINAFSEWERRLLNLNSSLRQENTSQR